jgi:hypothetical protein
VRLLDVLGGPDYEVRYPNCDRTATSPPFTRLGSPRVPRHPGDGELSEIAWFAPGELPGLQLSGFARALLHATGHL